MTTPDTTPRSRPMDSKKFVAFIVAEVTWKVLVGLIVVLAYKDHRLEWNALLSVLAVVMVAGFVEVGYIIGQASLDKYTKVAEIVSRSGHSVTLKDMSVTSVAPKEVQK